MNKQETLEEAAEKFFPIKYQSYMDGEIDINYEERKGFIAGTKWQQERSYSEEDMKVAFTEGFNARYKMQNGTESREKFIQQFKKK